AGGRRGGAELPRRRRRVHRRVELPDPRQHPLLRPDRPHPEVTMKAERVGKYRLIAMLGQGGMASVFLSLVPGPMGVNKLLVVKLLKDDLSQDQDFLQMFLNEARLAARLNHANVV